MTAIRQWKKIVFILVATALSSCGEPIEKNQRTGAKQQQGEFGSEELVKLLEAKQKESESIPASKVHAPEKQDAPANDAAALIPKEKALAAFDIKPTDGVISYTELLEGISKFHATNSKAKGDDGFDEKFDVNGDSGVNILDYSILISILPEHRGCLEVFRGLNAIDISPLDGVVDSKEAVAALANLKNTIMKQEGAEGYLSSFDVDANKSVNQVDIGYLGFVLDHFAESKRIIRLVGSFGARSGFHLDDGEIFKVWLRYKAVSGQAVAAAGSPEVKLFDLNGDGGVNILDFSQLSQIFLALSDLSAADLNTLLSHDFLDSMPSFRSFRVLDVAPKDGEISANEAVAALGKFKNTHMKEAGDAGYLEAFDIDANGHVNLLDFGLLTSVTSHFAPADRVIRLVGSFGASNGFNLIAEEIVAVWERYKAVYGQSPNDENRAEVTLFDLSGDGGVNILDYGVFSQILLAVSNFDAEELQAILNP